MANTVNRIIEASAHLSGFRYVPNIHQLTDASLTKFGYYRGFPCCYGHTIRDLDKHWCYECVRKIQSNNCAFDLNYTNVHYKTRLLMIWKQVRVGEFDECWESPGLTDTRIRFPSYRSIKSKSYSDNISAHKVIYNCTWGDVGKMFVTRLCKNKNCLNPLHLVSSWNRTYPPEVIHPFDYEFNPEKLMHSARNLMRENPESIVENQMKQTIQHPLVHKNSRDYDDDTQELYYGSYAQECSRPAAENTK